MRRALLLTFLIAVPAAAHDFWIEPSTFRPAAGANFTAGLRVGQNFVGDPVPRSASLIDRFTIRDASGQRPVNGFEQQDPAGYLRIDVAGPAIIGYSSKANPLELPSAKFEEFLKMEGLERISAARAARGEASKPDREHFFRYAKALVVAGGQHAQASSISRPLGYRLEIIPENDPAGSASFRARVLFEGKPLAGALVKALFRDDGSLLMSARSDGQGRVTFKLPRAGVWLVESVHMVAAPAGTNADWESLWASLTFER